MPKRESTYGIVISGIRRADGSIVESGFRIKDDHGTTISCQYDYIEELKQALKHIVWLNPDTGKPWDGEPTEDLPTLF